MTPGLWMAVVTILQAPSIAPQGLKDVAIVSSSPAVVNSVVEKLRRLPQEDAVREFNASSKLVGVVKNGALVVFDMESGPLAVARDQGALIGIFAKLTEGNGTISVNSLSAEDRGKLCRAIGRALPVGDPSQMTGNVCLFASPAVAIKGRDRSVRLALVGRSPYDSDQRAFLKKAPVGFGSSTAKLQVPPSQTVADFTFTFTVLNTSMAKSSLLAVASTEVTERLQLEERAVRESAATYIDRMLSKDGGLATNRVGSMSIDELPEAMRANVDGALSNNFSENGFADASAALEFFRTSEKVTVSYELALGVYEIDSAGQGRYRSIVIYRY
ncbi:MAG: hypothetical protein K1X67_06565 [Fimbriimonadaceae bacterium]|nr:hypothetical protein [Fimbriimonadaceae bacterium]